MTTPLSLSVRPSKREPVFSFIGRLAAANRVDPASFCQDMGINQRALIKLDPFPLLRMADLAGLTDAELADMKSWTGIPLEGIRMQYRGEVVVSRAVRNPDVFGCPVCLQKDAAKEPGNPLKAMVLRGEFLFRHSQTCSRDGHPLVRLWTEQVPTRRFLSDSMRELLPILESGSLRQPLRTPTAYDEWLITRLEMGLDDTWFGQHSTHAAATICYLLGQQLLQVAGELGSLSATNRNWRCYSVGFDAARGGENSLRDQLKSLAVDAIASSASPRVAFGHLYRDLTVTLHYDDAFDPFRDILRDIILDHWPFDAGEMILGQIIDQPRLYSVRTAAKALGLKPSRMRLVLAAENIIDARDERHDSKLTFPASMINGLNEKLDGLINVAVLRETFAISDAQLNALKAAKLVEPTVQRARARSAWDPTKIETFLSKLTEKSTDISGDDQNWEHIHDAAVRCRLTIGIVVAAVLKGDVAVGVDHKLKGYAAVHVMPEKVDMLAKKHFPEGQSPFVFGQALGIVTKGAMQALIDSGLMQATVILDPKSGKSRHRVTATDAEAFHAKFLTLRTAAAEVGEQKRAIKALIEANRVVAVSNARRSFAGIYLRQEIEAVLRMRRN